MKLQKCVFKREKDNSWEEGIAQLNYSWGCHDVKCILDKDLNKIESCFDYRLKDGPNCYFILYED